MEIKRLGIVAGNGLLPRLVLEEACVKRVPVTVAAIKEETDRQIEDVARSATSDVSIHWIGVGQLGKLVRVFKSEGVDRAVMVGQVKHVRIFAPGSRSPLTQIKHLPDWQMLKLLASLPKKDTGSLIGGIIDFLEKEGIEFIDSTLFLQDHLAREGVMTKRGPNRIESMDLEYGISIAREISRMDLGQTIVVKDQAVVAVEAMEGTDAAIKRAAELVGGERLTVIKVSRPNQDMRFDVPVFGMSSLPVLKQSNVSALAVDAGKTLLIDREAFIAQSDAIGLTVIGVD